MQEQQSEINSSTSLPVQSDQNEIGQAGVLIPAAQASKITSDDIFKAAAAGNDHDIDIFIQQGVSVNALHSENGTTPLAFAAEKNKRQTCELLISKYHADPNLGGSSPLQCALMEGAYDCAKYLLDKTTLTPELKSLATLVVNQRPASEIFGECQAQNEQVAVQIAGWCQWSLLRSAYERQIFVDINAALPSLDGPFAGITPLWLAMVKQQAELVKMMLEHSEDPNINVAPQSGMLAGVTVLMLAVWDAAKQAQWGLVKLMLKQCKNPDINTAAHFFPGGGDTSLLLAVIGEQWDVVKLMLEQCKNPNINVALLEGPNAGMTALWIAAAKHQWDVVMMMFERCKNPNINAAPLFGPNAGTTVLWGACEIVGQAELVKLMLERCDDADINAVSHNDKCSGTTPLLLVVLNQQWDLATMMLERCKDPNVNVAVTGSDPEGLSVLALAGIKEQWELFKLMLLRGKDPDINAVIHDSDGYETTPLFIVIRERRWDVVKIMLERDILNIGILIKDLANRNDDFRQTILYALRKSPENLRFIIDRYPQLFEQTLCPISEILQSLCERYLPAIRTTDKLGIECLYHALTVLDDPSEHVSFLNGLSNLGTSVLCVIEDIDEINPPSVHNLFIERIERSPDFYALELSVHIILYDVKQLKTRTSVLMSLLKIVYALPLEIIYMIANFLYRAQEGCHTLPAATLRYAINKFPNNEVANLFVSTFRRACGSEIAPELAERGSVTLRGIAQKAITTVAKKYNTPLFFAKRQRTYICKEVKELQQEQFNVDTLSSIIESSFDEKEVLKAQPQIEIKNINKDFQNSLVEMALKISAAFIAEKSQLIAPYFASAEGGKYLCQCVYLSLYHLATNGELLENDLEVHAEKFIENISRCDQLNHKNITQVYFDTCRAEASCLFSVA